MMTYWKVRPDSEFLQHLSRGQKRSMGQRYSQDLATVLAMASPTVSRMTIYRKVLQAVTFVGLPGVLHPQVEHVA